MTTLIALVVLATQRLSFAPLVLKDALQDKNFYGLSLLLRDKDALAALAESAPLRELGQKMRSTLDAERKRITIGSLAGLEDFRWTSQDIESAAAELERLEDADARLKSFVARRLRPSHAYFRDENLSDPKLLAQVWREAADGMNVILDVYGTQTDGGRSPSINGPLYKKSNPLFGGLLRTALEVIHDDAQASDPFFLTPLRLSTELLHAQTRDEAGRFEPMEEGENRAAVRYAKGIDWSKYQYSAILVPGYGPEEADVQFSPIGRIECEAAARRYFAKKAPFIVTSGGYVHPNRTPFCEALEMKKCLMHEFGVPEQAIFIDPHARHTTTNIRNTARILARDGVPLDKEVLIVTNPYQSNDIVEKAFDERCQSIFGFLPYKSKRRLGVFEVAITLDPISLSIDPRDPLDP